MGSGIKKTGQEGLSRTTRTKTVVASVAHSVPMVKVMAYAPVCVNFTETYFWYSQPEVAVKLDGLIAQLKKNEVVSAA